MIYIAIGVFLIVIALSETDRQLKFISREGYYLAILLMIGLASVRNGVGTDWYAYLTFYENTEESSRVEIGYSLLNNLFSHSGVHYNSFLFFLAAISIILITSFFKHAGALSAAALLLFYSDLFLYLNLSGMRQALAIAITCFSLRFAITRKPLPFFVLVALASSFHVSAAVFCLAYFIPRNRVRWSHLILIFFGYAVFFMAFDPIVHFITEYAVKNVDYYLYVHEVSDDLNLNYTIGILRRIIILGIAWAAWRDLSENYYFRYALNLYIFGLLIYLAFYTLSADIGVRISVYFTIIETIITGMAITHSRNLLVRLFIVALVSSIGLFKLFGYANNPYYTYNTIF